MMDRTQLRQAIRDRLIAANGSCNHTHITHTDGVVRGLLWALTGQDYGTELTRDVLTVCQIAGIPAHQDGELVHFDDLVTP
jgi:hypothetical protein